MKHPPVALSLVIIFSAIFIVDRFLLDGLLLLWGTLSYEKVALKHEWWRLITASFFHGGFIHVAANCLAIYFCGVLIESKIKSHWFLIVYLISNILEALVFVYMFTPGSSIGSSPGIFGLMAIIVIYCYRNRGFLQENIKSREMQFLIYCAILGNVLLIHSFGDFIARVFVHAAGFVFGMLIGLLFNIVPKDRTYHRTEIDA